MSKSHHKPRSFLNKPHYEGGSRAMSQFIQQHLQYPQEALENGIEGTVKVRVTIDHKGKVIAADVLDRLGSGCDEEAARVVKMLRFTIQKNRNLRVTFQKELNIHFKLPEKPASIQKINYIYRPQPEETASPSYTYRIGGE